MKTMPYDEVDKVILKFIQGDLPVESRPYQGLARELGLTEAEVVSRINHLKEQGIIRRVGAILRHQKAGFAVNAMTAWKVDVSQADGVGKILAGFDQVSHCYLRQVPPEFGYNLFAMVHAHDEDELDRLVNEMSILTGIDDYCVYHSIKEYKKVSMVYF